MNLLNKVKLFIKDKSFSVLKPQLVVKYRVYIGTKLVHENYCESMTFQFLMWLYSQFGQNGGNFVDSLESGGSYQNNLVRNITGGYTPVNTNTMALAGGLGDLTKGIILGTGTTLPSPLDYKLESIITHGVSVGQLTYNAQQSVNPPIVVGQDSSFKLQRIIVNGSGATINVSELGLYCVNYTSSSVFCIMRDVFANIELLDTKTATIELEFKITT